MTELALAAAPAAEDGWTARRVFQSSVSATLEERYTANPCGSFARTIEYRNELRLIAVGGEYHGENGDWFNITWSWDGSSSYGDEYRAVGNKQFAELYTTADGHGDGH